MTTPAGSDIGGHADPRFAAVVDRFRRDFVDDEAVGASLAVMIDGEMVIDLWGGFQNPERTRPWERDTLVCTMSAAKGIAATAAHMMVSRGRLSLDLPVATYWPEFAQAGKERITVRQLISHMAGLPIAEAAPTGAALEWEPLIRGLELQAPAWEPGTLGAYHSTTYGHLVGELVRRTSGRPFPEFLRTELAGPLGAEFILGCSDAEIGRVAPNLPNPESELMTRAPRNHPWFLPTYRLVGDPSNWAPDRFLRSVFASGAGVSNARSLARIFGALARGGSLGGVTLMDPETLRRALEEQWHYPDPMHQDDFRLAVGFALNTPEWNYFGPNPDAFGTIGGGGYGVFADPARRLSFAYTPGRFSSGYGLGRQWRRLVDATYAGLGPT